MDISDETEYGRWVMVKVVVVVVVVVACLPGCLGSQLTSPSTRDSSSLFVCWFNIRGRCDCDVELGRDIIAIKENQGCFGCFQFVAFVVAFTCVAFVVVCMHVVEVIYCYCVVVIIVIVVVTTV